MSPHGRCASAPPGRSPVPGATAGVKDVFFVVLVVCDGLKALPDAITTVWEFAVVQACIIHLIRNTFRFTSRKYWDQIAHDMRPIYTERLIAIERRQWPCARQQPTNYDLSELAARPLPACSRIRFALARLQGAAGTGSSRRTRSGRDRSTRQPTPRTQELVEGDLAVAAPPKPDRPGLGES